MFFFIRNNLLKYYKNVTFVAHVLYGVFLAENVYDRREKQHGFTGGVI